MCSREDSTQNIVNLFISTPVKSFGSGPRCAYDLLKYISSIVAPTDTQLAHSRTMDASHHDECVLSSYRWSNSQISSSSDSSESPKSNRYPTLGNSPRTSSRSSSRSDGCCISGHELVLIPVVRDRNTVCSCCSANIRVKPAQVLCYHCYECNSDACGECVTEEMMDTLRDERQKAMVCSYGKKPDFHVNGIHRTYLTSSFIFLFDLCIV